MVSYVSTSTISNLMDSNEESKVNVNMGILNERFDSVFVEFDTRITSYNVCYTKLLRFVPFILFTVFFSVFNKSKN